MAKKRYNLNKRKSNSIILLILALIFVGTPIVTLIFHIIISWNLPWM